MTIASVTVRIVDGGLSATRSSSRPPAVIGCSSAGTAATPTLISSVDDCVTAFGHGLLTELVAHYLALAGVPVLVCKAATATAGSCGAITQPAAPAAQLSVTTATAVDTYAIVIVVTRAAVDLAALTAAVKISLDGGENFGREVAVPSTGTLTIGDTGVTVDWADGTFTVDDTYSFSTTAPKWDNAALTAALDALAASPIDHEYVHVAEPVVRADATTVLTSLQALAAGGVYRRALLSVRDQTPGETVSAWQTALLGASPGFALFDGGHYLDVAAGYGVIRSRTTGALQRRSVAWVIGPREAGLRLVIDADTAGLAEHPGAVHLGSLAGIEEGSLAHDLRLLPSLDVGGFCGLQTHIGRAGYYATDRTMAALPSNYGTVMNARVVVEGATVAMALLTEHVGQRFRLSSSGTISPNDADAIDARLTADFRSSMGVLITEGYLTIDRASVSGQLRGAIAVRPYGYATMLNFTIGMTVS